MSTAILLLVGLVALGLALRLAPRTRKALARTADLGPANRWVIRLGVAGLTALAALMAAGIAAGVHPKFLPLVLGAGLLWAELFAITQVDLASDAAARRASLLPRLKEAKTDVEQRLTDSSLPIRHRIALRVQRFLLRLLIDVGWV
jgi:hypothetical protein